MQHKIEQRRLRFASIAGIERADLPLAAEVWQSELNQQIWISLDTVKLGTLFARYMSNPDEKYLTLNYLERNYQMDVSAVRDVLRQMKMYGVVEAFNVDAGVVRVSLRLSLMQRLRVLELRNCFLNSSGIGSMRELQAVVATEQWDLPAQDFDAECEEANAWHQETTQSAPKRTRETVVG